PRVGLHLRHGCSAPELFRWLDRRCDRLRPARGRSGPSLRVEVVGRTLRLLRDARGTLGLVGLNLLGALLALGLLLGLALGLALSPISFHAHARLGLLLVRSE